MYFWRQYINNAFVIMIINFAKCFFRKIKEQLTLSMLLPALKDKHIVFGVGNSKLSLLKSAVLYIANAASKSTNFVVS